MRGHAYKRGATWTVVYDEQPDENGKRRQRSKGGFATKREAEQWLTDTLAKIASGSYAVPSKLTVADFLEREWLPAVEGTLRPLSVQRYRSIIRLYVKPRIGSQRLQGLSGGSLNVLYGELEQAGLSVSTRRLVHAVIGRALRDAERWGRAPATWHGWLTRRHAVVAVRRHGRPASFAGSSSTSAAIGSPLSGGSQRLRECVAGSWPA
jgi:hypothetical protein